jgi:hypothetical protein
MYRLLWTKTDDAEYTVLSHQVSAKAEARSDDRGQAQLFKLYRNEGV